MMFPAEMQQKAAALLDACRTSGKKIAVAESCTGGLLSALLTGIFGASEVFTHGFITYANEAKTDMLGVDTALIAQHGAVSEPVARAMAEGALRHAKADIAIAITGIAGPGGGSAAKPVGTVHFGVASKDKPVGHQRMLFSGDRQGIRLAAADHALDMMLAAVSA